MTSVEKLTKSFEILKIPVQSYSDEQRKNDLKILNKKDKITHLNLVCENIVAQNVREAEHFSRNLGLAIETFLVFFDDEDRDVYFVAEECLNKIFKTFMDNYLIRFPADLYRFMKKNGPERSLKAALTRFAEICHFIKPQKCRIYVDFMIKDNILSKIAKRSEESIQSVLVDSMNRICATFCPSMTDHEIHLLIQSFLPNLSNNSSVNSYRRVSANCLSLICLYTASPLKSYHYLHGELLNLIHPIDENIEVNKFKVWGVLLCFRLMIIHLSELEKSSNKNILNALRKSSLNSKKMPLYFNLFDVCQIYEICVYFLNNSDISIVTAALECIQVVLKLAPFKLHQILTEPGKCSKSFLGYNARHLDTDSNSTVALLQSQDSSDSINTLKPSSQVNNKECEPSDQRELSCSQNEEQEFLLIQSPDKSIGCFYDPNTSNLTFLIRFLCYKFLLNLNQEKKLKSDNEVKILQKSIALDCCSSILTIDPTLIFQPLSIESTDAFICSLFDYIKHQDDKMRTNVCLLIGQFINTVLVNNCGNFDSWVCRHDPENNSNIRLELLINYLTIFITSENPQETNNICKRFALSALRIFLPTLVKTSLSSFVLEILINLIQLKNSTYNLVKCELVDLLASIDFKSITYSEKTLTEDRPNAEESQDYCSAFFARNTQERIIEEIFLDLIGSEDSKIRFETARCFTRLVLNCNFYEPTSIPFQNLLQATGESHLKSAGFSKTCFNSSIMNNDTFNIGAIQDIFEKAKSQSTSKTKYYNSPLCSLSFPSNPWFGKNTQILVNTFVQPFYSLIKHFPSNVSNSMTINNNLNKVVESNLNYIVPLVVNTLVRSADKYQLLGCIESLDMIFQTYQPALYYNNNLIETTNILLSFVRHPNIFFDLYAHDILLRTLGNLFSSLSWLNMKKIDKLILQLDQLLSNNRADQTCQTLIDLITNSVKIAPFSASQAEQNTGLTYFYSLSFNNQSLKNLIDSVFVHVTKVLCIFACVIDDTSLPSVLTSNLGAGSTAINVGTTQSSSVPTQVQPNQPSGSPSFIRSKISNLTERKSDASKEPSVVPLMSQLPKTTNSVYLGNFQNSTHYLKLYEVIKSAFLMYKKSPNFVSYDRFIQYLKTTLSLFAQLLEASLSVHEIAPHLDELLLYLRVIFMVEPTSATKCVTLCLKSLFGRNLAGLMFDYTQQQIEKLSSMYEASQSSTSNQKSGGLGQAAGSFLSGSLTSLASFNLPSNLPFNIPFNSAKRQSSLLTNLILTNQAQFTKFMFNQTCINDQPMEAQINQGSSLINLALDSLELSHISSIPSSSSQTSFSNASNKTISKSNQSASNFSLLSLIKKPKNQPNPASQANLSTSQENKIKQLKTDQKTLSQYIKSFEAIVLKSILQYTMTSSVNLQAKIMDLLIQLILLNVDYCSLDGEKIFFDYVLKQLESMEQKRINENSKNYDPTSNSLSKSYMIDLNESFDYETVYLDPLNPFDLDAMLNKLYSHTENNFNSNSSYLATIGTSPLICLLNLRQQEHLQAHLIIPKIFEFLIELANSRQNSSKISNKDRSSGLLGMSEIMRLCDNLIASENSFHTHVLMALRPIVIDLFLNRSMEDSRELEMQHEVIIKTMLRFVHYPSIWPLLNLVVLKLKKDNVDKWKKVSRQICDSIFDSIKSSKLKILDYNGHELRSVHRYSLSYIPCIESTKSLIQLFGHLHSSVYRPIDFIIMSMFEKSKELIFQENISTNLPENLSLFILHLYLLFTNASEDQILFRLQCLTEQISQMFHNDNQANKSSRKGSLDVLNFENENISMSASSNSFLFNFDYLENGEYDFSDSALFLGKFLLKILDVSFLYVRKNFKFNPNWFISAQNLASSTNSGAFLREHEMDELLNLNMVQHLIANQLQILIYIITCEKFAELSNVLSKLINFKSELYAERKFRPENVSRSEKFNCEYKMECDINDFNFDPSKFIFDTNCFVLFKYSKINPLLSSLWQYFLIHADYHNPDYWYQSLESAENESEDLMSGESSQNSSINPDFHSNDFISKSSQINKNYSNSLENKILFYNHIKIPTLNEKLFKYLSLISYCDSLNSNPNDIDSPSHVSMLIVKNLVDLFEFAPYEPIVIDFFGSVNRNAELSFLFLQSINTNWSKIRAKNELNLLESCLKAVEGIHLNSSCHLLSLLIEKFFKLPYLSLVRYADHIACQRVEMIHTLSQEELVSLFTQKNMETLDMFYESQAENGARHQRLFNLLEQLKQRQEEPSQTLIKTSTSIEFFNIYLETGIDKTTNNLDKEWFYNIVRSSCCYGSSSDMINDSFGLKSKQGALILANLDESNCESIINDKSFKLSILRDCLLLSAFRTNNSIQKLPPALKQAKNLLKDFIHPLWTVSSRFLFNTISKINSKLPELTPVCLSKSEHFEQYKKKIWASDPVDLGAYDEKFIQVVSEMDFYSLVLPLTESINSYLKSIKQYPYLDIKLNQTDIKSVLNFSLFQIEYINFITSNQNQIVSLKCLNESFLCAFNVLSEPYFINILSISPIYSTFVSYLVKDLYQLIVQYFFRIGDENLLKTPRLKHLIDYTGSSQSFTSEVLFNLTTLETLLKIRFIINSQVFRQKIPFLMRDLVEKIYIAVCRLPVLERFIRIPDCLWSQNFRLEYSQFLRSDTSVLPPIDNLKDPHVLKDHLRHILLIGWTTRNQFEYEYVNMLTFFHNISEDYYLPLSSQANSTKYEGVSGLDQNHIMQHLPAEEIKERNKCISLLIKGLSTWLIKSTLTPRSGNSLSSLYEHVSRNKLPGFLSTYIGQQYGRIKKSIDTFDRYNIFADSNSISIANNSSLLYMLDPTMIDESDEEVKRIVDFTQPQPAATLTNLTKISNKLNQRCNLTYSTNIERVMLNNLPTNSSSFFYFTQISLEGILKFVGQWNTFDVNSEQANSIGESIQSFVSNQLDEVSTKMTEMLSTGPNATFVQSSSKPNYQSPLDHSVQRSFNRNSLDIASVLRTILGYYESFFKIPTIQLKLDIFKSMLYLSNCLFDSKNQYESLSQKLQTNFEFLNLFITQDNEPLMPIVNDLVDDSTLSLAIYGECLAKCCLHTTRDGQSMASKDFERLNRLIENGLRSNSMLIKIATIQGLMYWLESVTLGYLSANNDAKILTDHLCKQIYLMKDSSVLFTSNYRYLSSLWSASFYIIENCLDSIRDAQNFCSTFIKLTYQLLNDLNTPYFLFYQLYLGLERLLLSCMVPSYEINTIQKLFTSKVYEEQKTLCLVSLTITSLYASNQGKQLNYWHDIIGKQIRAETASAPDSPSQAENPILKDCQISFPQILELNNHPELQSHLLKVLEVATSFLDRMKSSNTCKEASLYSTILPKILCDFLPPHNILNKLVTEFLNSSQHPYPQAVAYVVYKCFDLLQEKGMQFQIKEWCVLSLSNFLQRSHMHESIWLTSCLLVSASQNQWLKSTFPFLLNRYCAFETIDKAIFYMSVIEFIKLLDEAQVSSVLNAFEAHAKPGTPFEELVKLINKKSDSD